MTWIWTTILPNKFDTDAAKDILGHLTPDEKKTMIGFALKYFAIYLITLGYGTLLTFYLKHFSLINLLFTALMGYLVYILIKSMEASVNKELTHTLCSTWRAIAKGYIKEDIVKPEKEKKEQTKHSFESSDA